MDNIYENIEELQYKSKMQNIDHTWYDWSYAMLSYKNIQPTVTKVFFRGRKVNISLVFITKSHFIVPKNVKQNFIHCLSMKIPNIQELQQITIIHSSDVDFKDFMNLFKKDTAKPYPFLVIYTTPALDNLLSLRRNLLERI